MRGKSSIHCGMLWSAQHAAFASEASDLAGMKGGLALRRFRRGVGSFYRHVNASVCRACMGFAVSRQRI